MKASRSEQEVEEVKNTILSAALDLILGEGFDALTMRSLGRKTQMTAPNLYNYFSGKDEIYLTLMTRGFLRLTDALAQEAGQHQQPLERARGVMLRYIEFGTREHGYYDLMFSQATPKYRDYVGTKDELLSAEEHRVSMAIVDLATGLIQEVAEHLDAPLGSKQARVVLTGIWSLLHGAVSLANSKNLDYVADDVQGTLELLVGQIVHRATLQRVIGSSR